jgi:4-hydroxybutyrate CoA-transferase
MAELNLNVDWKQWYKDHLCTVQEAAKKIVPGDVLALGQATVIPYALLDELYAHKEDYHDVGFWHNVMNYPADMLFDHDTKKYFHMMSIFNLPLDRMAIDAHIYDVLGTGYDLWESSMWENGVNGLAVGLCPPDEDGWCNVSAYAVCSAQSVYRDPHIKKRLGFIDKTGIYPAPGAEGSLTKIHISELDVIVENDTEMMALPMPEPTDIDEKMAGFIAPYIKPCDKVEIGFGGLGSAILANLDNVEGTFEIFSEVFCDSMVPFVKSGKITKLRAASPSACAEDSFKWLATTDLDVALIDRTKTIEPLYIMQLENIVAINSTFMVDLLGQCCSEAQGLKPYTGMGGSFAYIYGAMRAPGGRSFICLRSTYTDKNGELQSNVVPWLPEGCIVSMLKNYVMFLVSEWGLADVFLKTLTERVRAIIKIADPQFRPMLKEKILTTPLMEEMDFEGYDMFDSTPPEVRQPNNVVVPGYVKYDFGGDK